MSQTNNEADIRDKIAQTFKQALKMPWGLETGMKQVLEYNIASVNMYSHGKF